MVVSDVLRGKPAGVVTVAGDQTITQLLQLLAEHGIGAVVVSSDGSRIDGIVSERDVVRRLASDGPGVLDEPVSAIMTTEVHTCGPRDEVAALASAMTQRRIRHVPVVDDGALRAIVSIGDIVKFRISQLEHERDQLEQYVQQ